MTGALSKERRIWKEKNFPKRQVFPINFVRRRLKDFSRQPKITWTLTRCGDLWDDNHTWGNFPGDGSRSKITAKRKNNRQKLLYTKSTLPTPPTYNRAYPGKLATASPGNPMDFTKPISLLLFVQQYEWSLENFCCKISSNKTWILCRVFVAEKNSEFK